VNDERIWAPWRIGYISGNEAGDRAKETQILPNTWQPSADHGCFLCRAAGEYADSKSANHQNLVVARDGHVVTLLNRFPYTNGHLLIAPLRHVADLSDVTQAEHLAVMQTLVQFTELFAKQIAAEGFNIGLNLGRVAGAGLPGHLHWHLVPRWTGDSNFIPTVAGVRVISQSLEALWEALQE
jgi:ATP adenylyltransferase